MAPSWTPDKLQKLLELLREHNSNLFLKSPSNMRKLNKDTFDMIANELNTPPQALRYKYFNLNSAYNTEVKKIESAKKEGFFYRPTLPWFNEFRDIMENSKGSPPEFSFEQEELKRVPSQNSSVSEDELELEEEVDPFAETSNSDAIIVKIKQEYIDGPLKESRDVDFDEDLDSVEFVAEIPQKQSVQQARPVKKAVKRRREKNQFAEPSAESPVPIDEFQMFANHVAEQLRQLNANSARKMQSEIHIIFDEEGFPFDSPALEDMT